MLSLQKYNWNFENIKISNVQIWKRKTKNICLQTTIYTSGNACVPVHRYHGNHGIHLSCIQIVGLPGIQMAFDYWTIWHPTSFRPFEYWTTCKYFLLKCFFEFVPQTVQIFQEGNVSPQTVLSDIQHLVMDQFNKTIFTCNFTIKSFILTKKKHLLFCGVNLFV